MKSNRNSVNSKLNLPETNFKQENIIMGIDEAGRGPVLGPMVYACCYFSVENDEIFKKEFGFADSKILTEDQRDNIYLRMTNNTHILGYQAIVIHPQEMSNKMLKREKISLNKISTDAAIKLIRDTINKGVNITGVFADTVGPADKYQKLLEYSFANSGINFKVTPKADSLFPTVSAASIVAKVTRDRDVKNWQFKENLVNLDHKLFDNNLGSGYPGDPQTKKWLQDNIDPIFGYPDLVRFSWKTTTTILDKNAIKIKYENYEEDEANIKKPFIDNKNSIQNIFKKKFNYFDQNEIKLNNFKF